MKLPPRACLLIAALSGCADASAPEATSAGLLVDTIATPTELPAQALSGAAVLADGRLALADIQAGAVWLVTPGMDAPQRLGTPGEGEGQLSQPIGVTTFGDTIAVMSAGTARIDLFESSGRAVGSRPVALELVSRPFELLPSGQALMATFGQDSALVAVRTLSGATVSRFGTVLSPGGQAVDPVAMKQAIRSGEVPAVFRNVVLPVAAPDGSIWMVLHTEGAIHRYAADGALLATATIPEDDVAPLREEFFRANTDPDQPGAIHAYLLAASGVADSGGAWFLLARPADRASVLLRVANDGSLVERLVVAESQGARLLLRDGARDAFYLVHQDEGVIVRVRRNAVP